MKPIVGYTTGVYDLYHVGHLNIFRNAKARCDHLIVGVSTDELVEQYKSRKPIVPYLERCEILQNVTYIDSIVAQDSMDKVLAWKKLKYDILFVGDDWYGTEKWVEIERELGTVNVPVVYLPYTKSTSSTKIREILEKYSMEE